MRIRVVRAGAQEEPSEEEAPPSRYRRVHRLAPKPAAPTREMKAVDEDLLQLARGESAIATARPPVRPRVKVTIEAAEPPVRPDPRREDD